MMTNHATTKLPLIAVDFNNEDFQMDQCLYGLNEGRPEPLDEIDYKEIARRCNAYEELAIAAKALDCVEPNIPGPGSDHTEEYRRGWLMALETAFQQAAPLRAALGMVKE